MRRTARILLAATAGLTALLGASTPSEAARKLTRAERQAIVTSIYFHAPNGGRITRASCIAGRLSTVNRRWAQVYLSNTTSCVDQYGGASGESTLAKRRTTRSRRWRRAGSISHICERGTGGASDRVLRDLGCTFY